MGEDKAEDPKVDEEAKKKKEEEEDDKKKEVKDLEFKAEVDRLTKENAEQKSELETLKSKVEEMDAAISKPVKKSMPETPKKDLADEKKSYPLDLIK